ncbi:MAG: 6-phosphogluconolactonase, partial [Thermobifida sp.]|nr:6-phosphogluconolactonase [Thermobifida sp.]
MVAVHTFEVYPTVEELNEAVGRAFLDRLNTLIDEAGADSRINLAISGGAL